jgi:Xaa-Pro aminopeptidase
MSIEKNISTDNTKENVGAKFQPRLLHLAQTRAWELLLDLSMYIEPGMTETEATEIYKKLQVESGAEKYWHPPKIRFGANTLCAFRDPSAPEVVLKKNDIFFLDIGPIYNGYEGDVGKTFVVGEHPAASRVQMACEEIFQTVIEQYHETQQTGAELYAYAAQLATEAGYELVGDGARGHRVSDFPHAAYYRGNLKDLSERRPAPDRWILEIQLRDHKNQVGAFYEDLITSDYLYDDVGIDG